jgi:hypothetical protein
MYDQSALRGSELVTGIRPRRTPTNAAGRNSAADSMSFRVRPPASARTHLPPTGSSRIAMALAPSSIGHAVRVIPPRRRGLAHLDRPPRRHPYHPDHPRQRPLPVTRMRPGDPG